MILKFSLKQIKRAKKEEKEIAVIIAYHVSFIFIINVVLVKIVILSMIYYDL